MPCLSTPPPPPSAGITMIGALRGAARRRWTSENLFILFERTYISGVFVIKNFRGSHIVLAGGRLNNAKNSSFHETPFWVTRTGALVTSLIISSYGN